MEIAKKILIVDDEKDFCFILKENLEITGKYKVVVATDGKSGLRAAMDHKPDLILLDIMMPVMDGFSVLKALKEDDRTLAIPVMMLTAKADDESKIKAASLYDEGYLIKPIEIAELKKRIEKVLAAREGRIG